jgi:hypothetical protein
MCITNSSEASAMTEQEQRTFNWFIGTLNTPELKAAFIQIGTGKLSLDDFKKFWESQRPEKKKERYDEARRETERRMSAFRTLGDEYGIPDFTR